MDEQSELNQYRYDLQGYLVIDTRRPVASLDGAVLEVSVNDERTAEHLRGVYRFRDRPTRTRSVSGLR